jgi:hypothetical protein
MLISTTAVIHFNACAKAQYIKYCKILRKLIKEAKKQHYIRLTKKYNNKINTTLNTIKRQEKDSQWRRFPTYL